MSAVSHQHIADAVFRGDDDIGRSDFRTVSGTFYDAGRFSGPQCIEQGDFLWVLLLGEVLP